MGTPHNTAQKGDIAKLVLMPGDPLRAKFMAETFLENPVQFNTVRGMLGFTGTYKGNRVSIMGSGMGIPSIGIYSYELFKFYDVEAIVRVGSTGAMLPEIKLYDVINVCGSYSDSTYALMQGGCTDKVIKPNAELFEMLNKSAAELGYPVVTGVVNSSDVFYTEENMTDIQAATLKHYNVCAAEMESFGLFHNANVTGKKAACLLTVSDHILTHEETTAEERQYSFTKMVEIALGLAKDFQ